MSSVSAAAGWPPGRPVLLLGGPWHGQLHVMPALWHTYKVPFWDPGGRPGYRGTVLYYLEWFVPYSVSAAARFGWGRPRFPVYVFPTYAGPARWR